MANEIFQGIKDRLQKLLKTANSTSIRNTVTAYREYGNLLLKTPVSGNQLLKGKDRLFNLIRRQHIGRMIMFFYNPKGANELPYYDKFPLVIPLEMYNDGFLGINLHYLPPMQRAKLLDAILNIYNNTHLSETRKLMMSYDFLRSNARSRLFEPCIKRYLYSHTKSRFYLIDPSDWQIAVLLPTERFEKASKTQVFRESMIKVKRH